MNTATFIFSLFIFFGMTAFAAATLLYLMFPKNRPSYVNYWLCGSLLIGIGVFLIVAKDILPELISYKFGNFLTTTGYVFLNQALSSLNGKNKSYSKATFECLFAGLALVSSLFFVEKYFGAEFQPTIVSLSSSLIGFYGFILGLQVYRKLGIVFAGVIAIINLAGSMVWFARSIAILFFQVGFAYQGGPINALTFISLLLLGVLRFTLFIGLVIRINEKEKYDLLSQFHDLKVNFANQKATQTERRLQHVLDVTGDGIWDWNIQTGEVKHNDRWIKMLGENPNQTYFSVEDFKNRIHPDDLPKVVENLENALAGKREYRLQYRMLRSDNEQIWVLDRGDVVERSDDGMPTRMVGAISDISDEIASKEKIQELIFFDSLTKLPNRQYIKDRIQRAIGEAGRVDVYSGLMYLDLDDFKTINDTYGHHIGDNLLQEFGNRLQSVIRPSDMVARIGGDEYLILFERLGNNPTDARIALEEVIKRILVGLSEEFDLGGIVRVRAGASMGAVVFGGEATQYDEILKHADIAMYAAKEDPGTAYRFFDETLKSSFERKNELHLGLKDAAQDNQFFVEYQPVVNRQQECIGYEALARWKHPLLGVVMPDDFIPFAEKSGQINQVGESILRNIFGNKHFWDQFSNDQDTILMINISAHQLMNLKFAEQFIALAEQYQIPLHRIHLELTEGTFVNNVGLALNAMNLLCKKEVKFVLDDFGTGYSSLTYLQKLPIQYIKLDKSFISGMINNKDDRAIVDNILSLARTLNLKVIVEGVETKDQYDLLRLKGCDFFQGWYFGRPGKIPEF